MKSSHLCTPRSLSEAVFHTDADPIERPARRMDSADRLVVWASLVALFVGLALVLRA